MLLASTTKANNRCSNGVDERQSCASKKQENNIEEMHKLGALLKDSDESACFCTPGSSKSSCLWRHSFCFFGK